MKTKALECGDCGNPAHFFDGKFMGCCSAGFCENEGYDTIEEWNSYTVNQLKQRARRCRTQSNSLLKEAAALESRLWGMGESKL